MTPLVSIVIPTYNEAGDISATLDAIERQDDPSLETIVVDASDDETPAIVSARQSARIRLVRQTRGRGRAAARNEGILLAAGSIVVILNADVQLPPDFATRIVEHYTQGADYVLVESRVLNVDAASARYVQALHQLQYPARPDVDAAMNWTEGFSCRRDAAIAVGLFPEGRIEPLVAGEDGWFGEKLAAAGYRKVFDRGIVVTHVVPADLRGFWTQRFGRGLGWPQVLAERFDWPAGKIARLAVKVCVLRLLVLAVPAASLWRGWQLAAVSTRGRRDWLRMAALDWIDRLASVSGLVRGVAARARA